MASASAPTAGAPSPKAAGAVPADFAQQITFIYCDDVAASEAFYKEVRRGVSKGTGSASTGLLWGPLYGAWWIPLGSGDS